MLLMRKIRLPEFVTGICFYVCVLLYITICALIAKALEQRVIHQVYCVTHDVSYVGFAMPMCIYASMLVCAYACPAGHFQNSRPRVLDALVRGLSQSERVRCTGTNILLCFLAFVYFTMYASMLLSE